MKAVPVLEMSVTSYNTTRRNNPDLLPQIQRGGYSESLFRIVKNMFVSDYFIFLVHALCLCMTDLLCNNEAASYYTVWTLYTLCRRTPGY
jgi:hypothetical protein